METNPSELVKNSRALSHSRPFRKIITGIALFLAICVTAVIGYMAAGWKLEDSIYMVIITIFGVGYGEVQPVQSPALRLLTIGVIIAGYGAVIYTVGGFMQMVIDGELNHALGARKMDKDIERLRDHTIVCGMGRMGTILTRELHKAKKPFVVIDCEERRIQQAKELGYLVIDGDATEERILEHAQINHASVLASVLSDDASNVFITITARGMNPSLTIVARGENPRTEKKLLGCGASRVVLPTAIGASKIAQSIIRPTAENLLAQLTSRGEMKEELEQIGIEFEELDVGKISPLIGKAIKDIEIRGDHGFLIVAIRRADGSVLMNPDAETKLAGSDVIISLGHHSDRPELALRASALKKPITYRGATADA